MSANQTLGNDLTAILRESILQLCRVGVAYGGRIEVDGILCITGEKEGQQMVVKVHENIVRSILSKHDSVDHLKIAATFGNATFEKADQNEETPGADLVNKTQKDGGCGLVHTEQENPRTKHTDSPETENEPPGGIAHNLETPSQDDESYLSPTRSSTGLQEKASIQDTTLPKNDVTNKADVIVKEEMNICERNDTPGDDRNDVISIGGEKPDNNLVSKNNISSNEERGRQILVAGSKEPGCSERDSALEEQTEPLALLKKPSANQDGSVTNKKRRKGPYPKQIASNMSEGALNCKICHTALDCVDALQMCENCEKDCNTLDYSSSEGHRDYSHPCQSPVRSQVGYTSPSVKDNNSRPLAFDNVGEREGTENFICGTCATSYKYKNALMLHYRVSHESTMSHFCNLCSIGFDNVDDFVRHRWSHQHDKSLVCDICKFHCVEKLEFIKHSLLHTGNVSTYRCLACRAYKVSFNDPLIYSQHLHIVHRSGQDIFGCCFCSEVCSTYEAWQAHEEGHVHPKTFSCVWCTKVSASIEELKQHVEQHTRLDLTGDGPRVKQEPAEIVASVMGGHKHAVPRQLSRQWSTSDYVIDSYNPDMAQSGSLRSEIISSEKSCTKPRPTSPSDNGYLLLPIPASNLMYSGGQVQIEPTKSPTHHLSGVNFRPALEQSSSSPVRSVNHPESSDGFRPVSVQKRKASVGNVGECMKFKRISSPEPIVLSGDEELDDCHIIEDDGGRDEQGFSCPICRVREDTFGEYEQHVYQLHARFACPYCHKTYGSRPNRDRHINLHTGETPYVCPECGMGFIRGDRLKIHRIKVHDVKNEDTYKYQKYREATEEGMYSLDPPNRNEAAMPMAESSMDELKKYPGNYSCDYTNYSFVAVDCSGEGGEEDSHSNAIIAMPQVGITAAKSHTSGEDSSASDGSMISSDMISKDQMDVQDGSAQPRPQNSQNQDPQTAGPSSGNIEHYQCTVCKEFFDDWDNYDNHVREHGRFPCRYCGEAFSQKGNRNRHERVHTGEKPYHCNFCEMTFARKDALQTHKIKLHDVIL